MGIFTTFFAILSFSIVTKAGFFLDNPFDGRSDPFRSVSTFDGNQNRFGSIDLNNMFQIRSDGGGGEYRNSDKRRDSKSNDPDDPKLGPTTSAPDRKKDKPTRRRGKRPTKYKVYDPFAPFDEYHSNNDRKKRKRARQERARRIK